VTKDFTSPVASFTAVTSVCHPRAAHTRLRRARHT
jgi:hypothetical protein